MLNLDLENINNFKKNGFLVKAIFANDKNFQNISSKFKEELKLVTKKNMIKNLGGYKSGNLNINLGIFGIKILNTLYENNLENFFYSLTGEKLNDYEICLGGNLNLPGSSKQIFHTDGSWEPRMIILSIATTEITKNNGPIELIKGTHLQNFPYWKQVFKNFFLQKEKIQMNIGDVLIREHRLWHRGTNNKSLNFREMTAIMFIKKVSKKVKILKDDSNKVYIYSNMYGVSFKEKIKEFISIYFKIILILYKILLSFKK